MRPNRIPVTVLGGYLGAGKTTILNQVLAQATPSGSTDSGRRIAVLVNDFGPINLDAALIRSQTDSVIELTNGCICCSLADGFAAALDQVRRRANDDPAKSPEHLIIETSGVALPRSVAQYAHLPGFVLDSIVVVADAEQIEEQAADPYVGETIRAQLLAADLVLLTKIDLVSPQEIEGARTFVGSVSSAPILPVDSGRVPLEVVIGQPPSQVVKPSALRPSALKPSTIHLRALEISVPAATPEEKLRDWLEQAPSVVLRVKGVVHGNRGLLRVDRVGSRTTIQGLFGDIDQDVVGYLTILTMAAAGAHAAHPAPTPPVAPTSTNTPTDTPSEGVQQWLDAAAAL